MYEADFDNDTSINLKDLVRILRKRRAVILIIFLLAALGSTIVSFLLPKVYEAETTLRIKQGKSLGESLLSVLPSGNPLATKQLMATYAEIIRSRTVIARVVRALRRDGIGPLDHEEVLSKIVISPVRDTEILKVQVRATSPREAQLLANTLVTVFLGRLSELVRSEQVAIRKFIAGRLAESKQELDQAESALEKYKSRQKIVAPADETKVLVERMADLNRLVATNQIELATGEVRVALAKRLLVAEKPGFVAENPLIQQCKSKLIDLEVKLIGLVHKYTENHPEVVAVRATINEVKQKLNEEINRAVNMEATSVNPIHQGILQDKLKAEVELAAASAQKSVLDKIVAQAEAVLMKLPSKEEGLARVMRNAMLAQEIYIMLAKRYEEARISEAMQPTDVQVIDRATRPDLDNPIAPNRKANVGIGAFLGLLLGVGLALLLEFINKTIISAEDVGHYLDLPVLGNIPVFNAKLLQDNHQINFWERWVLKRKVEG